MAGKAGLDGRGRHVAWNLTVLTECVIVFGHRTESRSLPVEGDVHFI